MRTINLFFAAVIMIALYSCGGKSGSSDKVTFSSAVEYNDFIVGLQSGIKDQFNTISDALNANDINAAKIKTTELENKCTKAIDTLNKLDAYNGNTAFRDAAINLFTHYKDFSQKGMKEELDIMAKPEINGQDEQRIDQLDDEFAQKEDGLHKTFIDAQKKFADENNLVLM